MKRVGVLIFLALTITLCNAQLTDDFSDGNFSANPESRNNADLRASVTAIWPNSPNTVGKPNFKADTVFFTTE